MASLDDAEMLGRLIRKTFVTCDDTGLSEIVLMGEGGDGLFSDNSSTDSLSTPPHHSPDITIQRDKKIKVEAKLGVRGKGDKGFEGNITDNEQEKSNEKGNLNFNETNENKERFIKAPNVLKSGVRGEGGMGGMMLEHDFLVGNSPWGVYSRLDATVESGVRTFTIHPTMETTIPSTMATTVLPPILPTMATTIHPFIVSIATTVDVSVLDFIGLVCWRYWLQDMEPLLSKNHPDYYDLLLVDSMGKVDWDLPPLDHHQPIEKFAFKHLAFVERTKVPTEMGARNIPGIPTKVKFLPF